MTVFFTDEADNNLTTEAGDYLICESRYAVATGDNDSADTWSGESGGTAGATPPGEFDEIVMDTAGLTVTLVETETVGAIRATAGTLNTNGQTIDCGTGSFECYYPAVLAKAGLPDTAITCGDFGLVGNLASFTDYGAASAWTLAKSGTGRIRHCTVAYLDASGSTGADVDAYSCTDNSDNSENIDFTTAPAQQPIAQAFAIAGLHV